MSFRCQVCGEPQKSGTRPRTVVTHKVAKGAGWRIAREIRVGPCCDASDEEAAWVEP